MRPFSEVPRLTSGQSFFHEYTEFFGTLGVRRNPNELNSRFNVIFGRNAELFHDARVLDIGSHDGRWSMAALNCGARHVVGIEGNGDYVEEARRIFSERSVPSDRYEFRQADMHQALQGFVTGEFEVILCLAVYYHTPHHALFFDAFSRIRPRHIIIDTAMSKFWLWPIILFRREPLSKPGNAVKFEQPINMALVGKPNPKWMRLAAESHGLQIKELDWHDGSIKDWTDLRAYKSRGRRTYVLSPTL